MHPNPKDCIAPASPTGKEVMHDQNPMHHPLSTPEPAQDAGLSPERPRVMRDASPKGVHQCITPPEAMHAASPDCITPASPAPRLRFLEDCRRALGLTAEGTASAADSAEPICIKCRARVSPDELFCSPCFSSRRGTA